MTHNMVAEVNNENTSFKEYYLPVVIVSHVKIHYRSFDETNYGYKDIG